jgi:hypothetical protein
LLAGQHMMNTWQGASLPPGRPPTHPRLGPAGKFPTENLEADGHAGTCPVTAFPANAYGMYSMLGNVWEAATYIGLYMDIDPAPCILSLSRRPAYIWPSPKPCGASTGTSPLARARPPTRINSDPAGRSWLAPAPNATPQPNSPPGALSGRLHSTRRPRRHRKAWAVSPLVVPLRFHLTPVCR